MVDFRDIQEESDQVSVAFGGSYVKGGSTIIVSDF